MQFTTCLLNFLEVEITKSTDDGKWSQYVSGDVKMQQYVVGNIKQIELLD